MALDWKTLTRTQRALIAGGGIAVVAVVGTSVWLTRHRQNAHDAAAAASDAAAGAAALPPPDSPSALAPAAAGSAPAAAGSVAPEPVRTTARITFQTLPPVSASVTWGATKLGQIPPRESLVITRPRDSGPLDVIVRAAGYLPVHTRAHTFGDSRILVKLTTPEQQSTLLGYRVPIDAGPPEEVEGEVPVLEPVAE